MDDPTDYLDDRQQAYAGSGRLDVRHEVVIDGRTFSVRAQHVRGRRLTVEFVAEGADDDDPGSLCGEIAVTDLVPAAAALRSLLSGVAVILGQGRASKGYDMRRIRSQYPNAYKAWTGADEERLTARFNAGASIDDLTQEFGRQPGAIRARLERLGLVAASEADAITDEPPW